MSSRRPWLLLAAVLLSPLHAASANVITDWDEKAVAFVQHRMASPDAYRAMAMVEIAMFAAVNAIEPVYQPYIKDLPAAPDACLEAAAASAAAAVLIGMVPDAAKDIEAALVSYRAAILDGPAKENGTRLGTLAATRMLEMRAKDGSQVPDSYRPATQPGVHVPTQLPIASQWPTVTPFAMTSPAQFRPKPPIGLDSALWAKDYNEVRKLGEKNSTERTARRAEVSGVRGC